VRAAFVDAEVAGATRELKALAGGRQLFRYQLGGELSNATAPVT